MASYTRIEQFSISLDVCSVGGEVAVSAYLRTLDGSPVPGRTLRFIRLDALTVLWEQPTSAEGYMGRYWSPDREQLGVHGYYLAFPGDSEYEGTTSLLIYLTVRETAYGFVIGTPVVRPA